ncbi:TetR/AcrR family transcriptional regulator [Actinacidiphila alni]|uniref:TetR/AcrR family transcriptional regulator n=1 Tax=Actinacidiphila alni TaxID=380248 RepID=UPI00345541E6
MTTPPVEPAETVESAEPAEPAKTAKTVPSPRSTRPTGRHHGDLRNALERAALGLVAERGAHGFTLAEASRRAGVSAAAPYKHFADRDALLASLAERGYREQHHRFSAAVRRSPDPVEQLADFAAAYVRFAVEERALFDITFSAGIDKSRYPALASAGDQVLTALLPTARRLASGEHAVDLILDVASAAHGLALYHREGLLGPPDQALARAESRARSTARALAGALPPR